MKYFRIVFLKKIYIAPWILLIMWLTLLLFSVFDRIIWVQGYLDITIPSIILLLFVIALVITRTIHKHQEVMNEHLIVLPFAGVVFTIAFLIVILNQPMTRTFYKESGQTIIVQESDPNYRNIIYFYDKEGIFGKKVAYCMQSNSSTCSWYISSNTLFITSTDLDTGDTTHKEAPLE